MKESDFTEDVSSLLRRDRPAALGDLDLTFGDREELKSALALTKEIGACRHLNDIGRTSEEVESPPGKRCEERNPSQLISLGVAREEAHGHENGRWSTRIPTATSWRTCQEQPL